MPLRIAMVAGEHSGDVLGADLVRELRERVPDARFFGIAGPHMRAAGCEAWEPAESLAVMGLFEIIPHLPRLLGIRSRLIARLLADPPDVYIGVDYKEFNLSVERQLKAAGIRTVQYVSPQVWAWRPGRVRKIADAVDLMLCLLPFERRWYEQAGIKAEFVGHPLADQIPMEPDRSAARAQLGLMDPPGGNGQGAGIVAVLPGSRTGEIERLGEDFAGAIRWLHERRPQLRFVAPLANEKARVMFAGMLGRQAPGIPVLLLDGQARTAMAAADAVLVASGTATLEAALSKRPMVVAYRVNAFTAWVVRRLKLIKSAFIAQPNLLANRALVPEVVQEEVRPEVLGAAVLEQLEDAGRRRELIDAFTLIHRELKRGASARAAEAIVALVRLPGPV